MVDAVAVDADLIARTLTLAAGTAVVFAVAGDAVSTLVTTRRRSGRLWPTQVFYQYTWRAWRALGRRIAAERSRERFLSVYGPASLLGLLVVWVVLLIVGWGLVWWALRAQVDGVDGFLDAVYFAGVGFFTVGFGDVVPVGGLARMLSLAEVFMGLGTIALVIGYLPTLFGAYSRREVQLLTLDDLSDGQTSSAGLIESYCADGRMDALEATFGAWERWCAEVFDSHTAYPMLATFRSRQPGQHWLTALAVVADAAAISLAAIEGTQAGPARRLYRRATRLLDVLIALPAIGQRVAGDGGRADGPGEPAFRDAYQRLARLGLPLRPYEPAWDELRRLRSALLPHLLVATELLLVSREFRNQAGP
jgi:Ion channel